MICPNCGWDNVPGNELCQHCQQSLTALDQPTPTNPIERSLMEDAVQRLRPRPPLTVAPTTPLGTVITLMVQHDVGAVLVVDEAGQLQGIFSEHDLLRKIVGLIENPEHLLVGAYMTPRPETVTASDTLNVALHKMDVGGYRHLPVVGGEQRPLGVISVRDMLRHLTQLCQDS